MRENIYIYQVIHQWIATYVDSRQCPVHVLTGACLEFISSYRVHEIAYGLGGPS